MATKQAQRARDAATVRREMREADQLLQEIYEEGIDEGVRTTRDRRRSGGHETPAQGAARARRTSRRSPRRRRRRRPAPIGRAARELRSPVVNAVYSGAKVAGMMLTLVALYLVLENAGVATEALGGVRKGFDWLRSPDRSIKYNDLA